jgi:hypothetical protein
MWHHVDLVWTNVSEERIASIFRVEKSASEEPEDGGDIPLKRWFAQDLHGAISRK